MIGEQIKSLRINKSWTQEYLADAANMNVRTIQRIESGDTKPRYSTVEILAGIFGAPDLLEAFRINHTLAIKVVPYKNFYLLRRVKIKDDQGEVVAILPMNEEMSINLRCNHTYTAQLDYNRCSFSVSEDDKHILIYWDLSQNVIINFVKLLFKNSFASKSVNTTGFRYPETVLYKIDNAKLVKPNWQLSVFMFIHALMLLSAGFYYEGNPNWWTDGAVLVGFGTMVRLLFYFTRKLVYSNKAWNSILIHTLISLCLICTGQLDGMFKSIYILLSVTLIVKGYMCYYLKKE